jgi:predicted TIM-barrel fold metal-dependent hydrolase
LIVDAHIHLWEKGTPRAAHRQAPYSRDEALADMAAAGVDAAVIQPPAWDPDADRIAMAAAALHPQRFAVLASVPIGALDGRPGVLGLRYIYSQPQHAALFDGDEPWAEAEKRGIPIALALGGNLSRLARVAERFPRLKLAVDHLGVPVGARGEAAFAHLADLISLARFPNVAVKASALPACATDGYPYRSVHEPLHRAFDAFGPRRVFWGTDITKMPCSWRQCVTMFTEELPWLSGGERDEVMGRALCDWLGWRL